MNPKVGIPLAIALLCVIIAMVIALVVIPAPGRGKPRDVQGGRVMDIATYVSSNISELSPVKEQLGGKFYVTSIQAKDGRGTVSYEDGHNAYTADFTYTINDEKGIVITSFSVR